MLGAVVLSKEYIDGIISRISQKYGVDPDLIRAVIKAESNWDVNASRFEAHKGDASWGLMQVMLATARQVLGDSSLDTTRLIRPETNIEAGTKFLSQLLARYKNVEDAVAAYNAGTPRRNVSTGKYVNQGYVDKVMSNYRMYKSGIPEGAPAYLIIGLLLLGVALTR